VSAEQIASGGMGIDAPRSSKLATFGRQISMPAMASQLIWGLNVSTLKYTISQLDPYVVGCLRNLTAALILFVILWRSEGAVGLRAEHWPRLLFISFFGIGLNTALWQIGLSLSSATNASLLSTVSPLIAILLAVAIGQETMAWRRALGMVVALLGVGLIVQTDGLNLHNENVVGDLAIMACAVTWASYNVFGVPLLRSYSPLRVTAWSMLLGSIAMVLFSPLVAPSWDVGHASALAWGGLLYAILFGTVLGQTFWSRAIQAMGASATMVYSYLQPLIAVGIAAVLLGERLEIVQILGGVFVLVGVTLGNRRGLRRRARAA
jgi:drug/metabolite transporter (DMT)-like permease